MPDKTCQRLTIQWPLQLIRDLNLGVSPPSSLIIPVYHIVWHDWLYLPLLRIYSLSYVTDLIVCNSRSLSYQISFESWNYWIIILLNNHMVASTKDILWGKLWEVADLSNLAADLFCGVLRLIVRPSSSKIGEPCRSGSPSPGGTLCFLGRGRVPYAAWRPL